MVFSCWTTIFIRKATKKTSAKLGKSGAEGERIWTGKSTLTLTLTVQEFKGSRVQKVQEFKTLTVCVEIDFCLACYCSAMLKQVYHCSRSSAAFLRHGIADASIALLIWLKRNLQDEKALTLYFRKKGIQTGALCLYLITLQFLLQEPHLRDGDDAHAQRNPRASLTVRDGKAWTCRSWDQSPTT